MSWFSDRRRREDPRLAEQAKLKAEAKAKQETKLAEWEDFKPVDIATSKGELVPVNTVPPPAPVAKAKPAPAPQAKPAQTTSKPAPAPKPKKVWGAKKVILDWLGRPIEDEEETELEPKKYYEQPELKPEQKAETKPKPKLETATKETFKPAPIAMQPAPVPAVVSKPTPAKAPAPAPQVAPSKTSRLSPEEIQLLKDQEADLAADVKTAQRAYRAQVQSDEKSDEAQLKAAYQTYARSQNKLIDEMISLATEREDTQAAVSYRGLARDIAREEALRPPKPAGKPTFEQYMANQSRYGKAPGVKSTYSPTASDVAAQPFKVEKAVCTGYGYKAAENCQSCRQMGAAAGQEIHCPCKCGHHNPIDRNYNPFGGEEPPPLKGVKGSTFFR
jgi:hypothetical protein